MENIIPTNLNADERILPTDPEVIKGIMANFFCCEGKKCCKKYKRGKRCKKCPNR